MADRADVRAQSAAFLGQAHMLASLDPRDGSLIGRVPNFPPIEVESAMACVREAQPAWGARPVAERARVIRQLRDAIVEHSDELATLISRETGKPEHEALSMELLAVADLASWFSRHAERILAPQPISLHLLRHRRSYLHFAPRGVVAIIAPWNFPFAIGIGDALMALLAGNAVLLKPSEHTPLHAVRTREFFIAAGLDPNLLWVVTGEAETGRALIEAQPDQVIFTGSVAAGRKVGAACGERLIPCTLELGGKAAAIVCEDADIERTARALVWGGFANQGQVCASVERVFVPDALHDRLVDRMLSLTAKLERGRDLGVMTTPEQLEDVSSMVAAAIDAGAKLRCGGERVGPGLHYAPTILTEVTAQMAIAREEIFGPVLPVLRVTSSEAAIALANDSELGLTGYVFTQDRSRGQQIAERLEVGTAMVNDCIVAYGLPETPWGGLKSSGVGHTHGESGLRNFCQQRHVHHDRFTLGRREPWWYPYRVEDTARTRQGIQLLFGGVRRRLERRIQRWADGER